MTARSLLVVAGEASGDRIASLVIRETGTWGVPAFGIGGPACRSAGVDTSLGDVSSAASMGLGDLVARLGAFAPALARLLARVLAAPPRAALLVNLTEVNARLGALLRARGVRVLWCVAPQVWAWRPGRLATLRGAVDRLAVLLPFEEALWRRAGFDAHYVGHPSLDAPCAARATTAAALGLAPGAVALAVLPGSRAGEVLRLAAPFCEAAATLRSEGAVSEARVLRAASLRGRARAHVDTCAARARLDVADGDAEHGAAPLLGAFDAALCASGTGCLEAALAGAAPVVAYRLDPVSFAVARRLVRTPHIALPNVLLGRRAFPELLQGEVTAPRLAVAVRSMLEPRGQGAPLAAELRRALAAPTSSPPGSTFGQRVASLLEPLLG